MNIKTFVDNIHCTIQCLFSQENLYYIKKSLRDGEKNAAESDNPMVSKDFTSHYILMYIYQLCYRR